MRSLLDITQRKNFTPLVESLFSLDRHPELMKKAHDILNSIMKQSNLRSQKK
jgi:hypothetical protein